jgi:hypothetical protein
MCVFLCACVQEHDSKIGWDMAGLERWWVGDYRIDWILVGVHRVPTLPPSAAASALSDADAPEPVSEPAAAAAGVAGVGVVAGDVKIDRMGGCSDHLAVRGVYTFA